MDAFTGPEGRTKLVAICLLGSVVLAFMAWALYVRVRAWRGMAAEWEALCADARAALAPLWRCSPSSSFSPLRCCVLACARTVCCKRVIPRPVRRTQSEILAARDRALGDGGGGAAKVAPEKTMDDAVNTRTTDTSLSVSLTTRENTSTFTAAANGLDGPLGHEGFVVHGLDTGLCSTSRGPSTGNTSTDGQGQGLHSSCGGPSGVVSPRCARAGTHSRNPSPAGSTNARSSTAAGEGQDSDTSRGRGRSGQGRPSAVSVWDGPATDASAAPDTARAATGGNTYITITVDTSRTMTDSHGTGASGGAGRCSGGEGPRTPTGARTPNGALISPLHPSNPYSPTWAAQAQAAAEEALAAAAAAGVHPRELADGPSLSHHHPHAGAAAAHNGGPWTFVPPLALLTGLSLEPEGAAGPAPAPATPSGRRTVPAGPPPPENLEDAARAPLRSPARTPRGSSAEPVRVAWTPGAAAGAASVDGV